MSLVRVYSEADLPEVVAELQAWGTDLSRWLLRGPLGAGKTALVRTWVGPEVHSPTFTYIHQYTGAIYHVDLYRFPADSPARWEALYELLDTAPLIFVEWAERLPWGVTLPYADLFLEPLADGRRRLTAARITADYQ